METIEIKSLEDYTSQIHFLEETDLFRGMGNDKEFKLIPSAGRFGISDAKTQREFEIFMLNDFKRKASLHINSIPKNDIEWLILAQHHGLPTRLLDWTFNPLVALFFAVENDYDEDCCVYRSYLSKLITPEMFNSHNPFEMLQIFQIIPTQNHIRYQNQNGLFTIHPEPSKEDFSLILTKYIIPKRCKNSFRWKLRKIGITKSLIFPGLDSVSYDILKMTSRKYEPYLKI